MDEINKANERETNTQNELAHVQSRVQSRIKAHIQAQENARKAQENARKAQENAIKAQEQKQTELISAQKIARQAQELNVALAASNTLTEKLRLSSIKTLVENNAAAQTELTRVKHNLALALAKPPANPAANIKDLLLSLFTSEQPKSDKDKDKDKTDPPIKKTITIEDLPSNIITQLGVQTNFTYIGSYTTGTDSPPATASSPTTPKIISKTYLFWDKTNNKFHSITDPPEA